MQQPTKRQLGAMGATAVTLFFEKLGWGVVTANDHDLGTDLVVQIRDPELREMGLMLGVQVKTGNSHFKRARALSGQRGWYFREKNQRHANYWSNHPLPHIVVLVRPDIENLYWTFASRDTIERTGKGFKIRVPAAQRLDASFRDIWIAAADAALKRTTLEGASWSFNIASVPESRHAAYALLAPRLVAPHPNRENSPALSWPEAVALCLLASVERWEQAAEKSAVVPSFNDSLNHAEWGWRFAGAVFAWTHTGDVESLARLDSGEQPEQYQIARAVTLAVALVEAGRVDEVDGLLAPLCDEEEQSLEQAWLSAQRSWIAAERGDLVEAHRLAEVATVQIAPVAADVTVSAVRAGAAWSLFDTSPILTSDLEPVITALDNPATWWRTEATAAGLLSAIRRRFASWSHDNRVSISSSDPRNDTLASVARIARLASAHAQARTSELARGMAELGTRSPTESRPLQALTILRAAGHAKELSLAILETARTGPLTDLGELVNTVDLGRTTRSTSNADLVTVGNAGLYASDEHARQLSTFVLDALADQECFAKRLKPRYHLEPALFKALVGLRYALDAAQWSRIIEVISEEPWPDEVNQGSIRTLLRAAPLSAADRTRLLKAAPKAPDWLQSMVSAVAGIADTATRADIRSRLLEGDMSTLGDLRSLDLLEPAEASIVATALSTGLRSRQPEIGLTVSRGDGPRDLAAVCVLHPDVVGDAWIAIAEFLADPLVPGYRKRGTALLLCRHVAAIPANLKDIFATAAESAREHARDIEPILPGFVEDVGAALDLLAIVLGDGDPDRLLMLLTADEAVRRDAIDHIAEIGGYPSVLMSLLGDGDPQVAAAAARGLAIEARQSQTPSGAIVRVLGQLAAHDSNVGVHVTAGLISDEPLPYELAQVVEALRKHPSAHVRHHAKALLVSSATRPSPTSA